MKPHVKFGLIGAGAIIIWSLIGYIMGNDKIDTMKYPGYIVMLGIMIYTLRGAIIERKNTGGGFISFGKAYGVAMLTSLITWVIYSVFSFFYFKFINPELIDVIKDIQIAEYEKQGMSEEQIEQITAMSSSWMNAEMMAIWSFLGMMIGAALLSLIIAAVLKKENPNGMLDNVS
ncbi:MAG TPA: DUF4199 domain-containing protein [Bacteroidia bacterium]|nr:DUF4199 domain-containing protein [Bacteroidia bacterium]HNU33955.1 DUF4199 domain-containing protein [Bacteroidia bacterium]